MYSIHLEKSTAHAVSAVRKTRLLYFDRRRGVWLQNRSWDAAQAGRHALDRQGRQRHHRPALQQAQRTLPGFLGTPLRAKAGGCMTSLNLMCAQRQLVNPVSAVISRAAMNTRALALALFLGFCPLGSAPQTSALSSILVKAGRLLDVRKGAYLENAGIWIAGQRIKEVGHFPEIQAHVPKEHESHRAWPRDSR